MGTRSLTIVKNEYGECCVLYRQYDGYPTGHGLELRQFLNEFKITNGLGIEKTKGKIANGMDCLAAQLVAHFKKEAGNFYLLPSGTRNCSEEYIYTISQNNNQLHLKVQSRESIGFESRGKRQNYMQVLYEGEVNHFLPTLENEDWMTKENDFVENQVMQFIKVNNKEEN